MRRILLTLPEDATATECGSCDLVRHVSTCDGPMDYCARWTKTIETRLPECLAAEAAAARMVEIAPEDARDGTVDAPQANREANPGAYMRVYKALRAHAAKAEVKR